MQFYSFVAHPSASRDVGRDGILGSSPGGHQLVAANAFAHERVLHGFRASLGKILIASGVALGVDVPGDWTGQGEIRVAF